MMKELQTLLWFSKRPQLYPHLMRLVYKKLFRVKNAKAATKQEMQLWCASRCVDTASGLKLLTSAEYLPPLARMFPTQFANAEAISNACPVVMGGPGDLDLLYGAAEHLQASKVVETGVAYGWSSLAILLSLQARQGARLISTDMPYPTRNNDAYVGCVVPEELKSRWQILRYADRQALPKSLRLLGQIDMCHYDSDKTYEGRMWAYPLLWKALRPGGFFISDDIGDNVAFRDFASEVQGEPIVIAGDNKYIGVIVKR